MEDVPARCTGQPGTGNSRRTRKGGMDLSHLTQKSQEALRDAQTRALRFGHQEVDGEHLLLALLGQPEGIAPRLLSQVGADPGRLGKELEAELSRWPRVTGPGVQPGQVTISQRLARLLGTAQQEADRLKDEYVSVEHLMLALISEGPTTAAGRLLHEQGVTRDRFLEALTVKVNGDTSPKLQQRFAAQAIPALLVLRHGRVTARRSGAGPPPTCAPGSSRRSARNSISPSLDQAPPRRRRSLQPRVRQPPGTVAPQPGPAVRLARLEFSPEPVQMADQLAPQRPPDELLATRSVPSSSLSRPRSSCAGQTDPLPSPAATRSSRSAIRSSRSAIRSSRSAIVRQRSSMASSAGCTRGEVRTNRPRARRPSR